MEAVNAQINSEDLGRLFAVVHVAGFQRKVTVNDIIVVETSSYPSVGTRIRLEKVRGGVLVLDRYDFLRQWKFTDKLDAFYFQYIIFNFI